MSHVIPSQLFQVLKSDCWNCNVFWGAKKSKGTQITCDFWRGVRLGVGLRWGEAPYRRLGPGGQGS